MTVEFGPARPLLSGAPRKRLGLPSYFPMARTPVALLAHILVVCTTAACSDRANDTRAALTTSAARELAQTQPTAGLNAQPNVTFAAAANSPSSNSADGANGAAALAAVAVRSPARPGAADGNDAATDADNAPLATPVIHTAD